MRARPVSITLVGWLFICVGCISFVSHTWRFASDAMRATGATGYDVRDFTYAQISAVLALVGGVGVLRGGVWARWLCVLWLAAHIGLSMLHSTEKTIMHAVLFVVVHIGLSMLHSTEKTIMHAVLFVVVTAILFRPRVAEFFRAPAKVENL